MLFRPYFTLLLGLLFLVWQHTHAQSKKTNTKRYEIDMKRVGVGLISQDALVRGREFIRIDSTYYVGWMYRGAYEMEHAADVKGYQIAANTFVRALTLLYHDFKKEIATRTNDVNSYIKIAQIHRDWDFIQYALFQCYSYSNQTEKVWQLLQDARKVNLQDEFMTETYNAMAWTIHRNRMYSNKEFSFLKNSIQENEAYAHALLDSSLQKIIRDQRLMESYLIIDYKKEREPGIWHYRAILHGYNLAIPQADSCYRQLRNTPYFPLNNYATFNLIQGKFDSAAYYYQTALKQENTDKRLNESHYYHSILDVYRNQTQSGISNIKKLIKDHGSNPGFGWYQLALARLYMMHGDYDNSAIALKKAASFNEIHIGTTLGETHYQFTINTLSLCLWEKKIKHLQFSDRRWYWRPYKIAQYISWHWKRFWAKIAWVNQVKKNPERQTVLYQLFASESTLGFHEILSGLRNVSPNYFERLFNKKLNSKSLRPALTPYWHLAIAEQLMQQQKWQEAKNHLESIISANTTNIVSEYHRLLLGTTYSNLIQCHEELKQAIPNTWYNALFDYYPQLIVSSNLPFPIRIIHDKHPYCQQLLGQLNKSKLKIVNSIQVPTLQLSYDETEKKVIGKWFLPKKEVPVRRFTLLRSELTQTATLFSSLFTPNIEK